RAGAGSRSELRGSRGARQPSRGHRRRQARHRHGICRRAARGARAHGPHVKSMTGFGAATAPLAARSRGSLSVEVRGVNQRFLDLKLSLPKEYVVWESEIRKLVQERVGRGRVEIYVSRSVTSNEGPRMEIDEQLASAYVQQWRSLKRKLRLAGEIDLSL